jgi:hypothetical protein
MRRPPIEFVIARSYDRWMPWASKVRRLPGVDEWSAWPVGENVPANNEGFTDLDDAQAVNPQDTLAP